MRGASAGGGSPQARAATRRRTERRRRAARRAERRATRRLRRTVARLSFCLDELATLQRRVLVLRAGLGAAPPRSRARVARVLEIRPQRVRRLERTGLERVRSLANGGECGGTSGGGGTTGGADGGWAGVFASTGGGGGGGLFGVDAAEASPGSSEAGNGGSGSGSGAGDGGEAGGVRGEANTQEVPGMGAIGGGDSAVPGGTPVAVAIALILLALLAGFAAPQVRGHIRSG